MFAAVNELPEVIQKALRMVGYHRRDISLKAAEMYSPVQYPHDGQKAFVTLTNLCTEYSKTYWGSWGGANMFSANQVDIDTTRYPIPTDCVVIEGAVGNVCYATIKVHPSNMAKMLKQKAQITERQ